MEERIATTTVCRIRSFAEQCLSVEANSIIVNGKSFEVDVVADGDTSQKDFYAKAGKAFMQSCPDGRNRTVIFHGASFMRLHIY